MLHDDPTEQRDCSEGPAHIHTGQPSRLLPNHNLNYGRSQEGGSDRRSGGHAGACGKNRHKGAGAFSGPGSRRQGRNLLFSLVLRPGLEASSQLSMMSSLALATALGRLVPTPSQVSIKWPNDVRVGGRKIGGILIEGSASSAGSKGFAIVGMGVNVNFDPGDYPEIRDIATSLMRELGHPFPRLDLLTAVLEEMESLYVGIRNGDSVRERWASLLDTVGPPHTGGFRGCGVRGIR